MSQKVEKTGQAIAVLLIVLMILPDQQLLYDI